MSALKKALLFRMLFAFALTFFWGGEDLAKVYPLYWSSPGSTLLLLLSETTFCD